MKGISSSLAADSGLPALRASSSAISSPWDSSASASFSIAAARSAGVVDPHASKAFVAAATARSTSSCDERGDSARVSPVAGLTTVSASLAAASTNSPSMKLRSVGVEVAVLMLGPYTRPPSPRQNSGARHRVIKLVFVLRRKPSLSREEFQRYWRERHAPLVA